MPADFVIHSLRHTALTRWGLAGVDFFTILRLVGHSSIQISARYVPPTSDAALAAIEKVERMMEGLSGDQGQKQPEGKSPTRPSE